MGDQSKVAVEAALQLAARAIAHEDHEFGLELCKRAASVIYDPRICSMMGECYELKGLAVRFFSIYLKASLSLHLQVKVRKIGNLDDALAHYKQVTRSKPSARTARRSPWTPP